jgi:hypothetical protein
MSNSGPAALTGAVLQLAEQAGEQGVAMGTLVDTLEGRGHNAQDVEMVIWGLLSERRLTPSGFLCRTVTRRGGGSQRSRVYEFLLVPWSPNLDHQLELPLEK